MMQDDDARWWWWFSQEIFIFQNPIGHIPIFQEPVILKYLDFFFKMAQFCVFTKILGISAPRKAPPFCLFFRKHPKFAILQNFTKMSINSEEKFILPRAFGSRKWHFIHPCTCRNSRSRPCHHFSSVGYLMLVSGTTTGPVQFCPRSVWVYLVTYWCCHLQCFFHIELPSFHSL